MPTDWENRYQTGDMPWEKGAPSPGLEDFLAAHPELSPGNVLVPGCGSGHDVRAWARAGYSVAGLDLAPSAIRLARERSSELDHLDLRFIKGDFLADEPDRTYDWLFEHTLYCAIEPAQRDEYRAAVARWLAPGGSFLAVHYLIPDEDGPPYGTTVEEINARFGERFALVDSWLPRSYPNRAGLERIFWWQKR
jgi:SAM-dependent methyltransferase